MYLRYTFECFRCKAPVPVPSSRKNGNGHGWWQMWRGEAGTGAGAREQQQSPRPYEGKVLIVARGGCMFEEKVVIAQQAGAVAVVVANTEVRDNASLQLPLHLLLVITVIDESCIECRAGFRVYHGGEQGEAHGWRRGRGLGGHSVPHDLLY